MQLRLSLTPLGARAALVGPEGTAAASARDWPSGGSPGAGPGAGPTDRAVAAEDLWRTVLTVAGDVLDGGSTGPDSVLVSEEAGDAGAVAVVVWDAETLGAERAAALLEADDGSGEPGSPERLAGWLAEHDARTWAHVRDGRSMIGPLTAYVVARATRGTWAAVGAAHPWGRSLRDHAGAWDPVACRHLGLPDDALPETVPEGEPFGRTDPVAFLGLQAPLAVTSST